MRGAASGKQLRNLEPSAEKQNRTQMLRVMQLIRCTAAEGKTLEAKFHLLFPFSSLPIIFPSFCIVVLLFLVHFSTCPSLLLAAATPCFCFVSDPLLLFSLLQHSLSFPSFTVNTMICELFTQQQ